MKTNTNSVSTTDIQGAILKNGYPKAIFSLEENEIPNVKHLIIKFPCNDFAPKVKQDSLILCKATKQYRKGLYLVLRGNDYCIEPKAPKTDGLTNYWILDRIVSQILE